jgi:transcriptional regulator with XRE-family HTH domain
MTTDERIGTNVHELLWKRRVRQSTLAAAMGLSLSSLAKKMRGEVVWKAEDIEKAAEVLNVDPGRLFVAGAGFEPATSGSRARLADVLALGSRADYEQAA